MTLGRARGSLAAVRALAAAGWYVGIGAPADADMVTASRGCSRRHEVPRPRGDAEGFVNGVRRAVSDHGYDVVFGGADDWMAALSTYADMLPVRVAHPSVDVVSAAIDKADLAARAEAAGIAAPSTKPATDAVMSAWDGPVIVKCRAHWHPGQQHTFRIEATHHPNIEAASERVWYLRDAGFEPLLQRPVEGELGALIGVVHEGRLVGRVQQRSSRLWPTPFGVSTRAVTVPVDEDLAARASALLVELGWSGLVELQFIHDADGVPHLIDLNGRFYGSMALAIAAGVNLPDAWGRQALGLELPCLSDAPAGVRFAWAAGDLRRAFAERRGGLVPDVLSTMWWAHSAQRSVWDGQDRRPTWDLVRSRLKRVLVEPVR